MASSSENQPKAPAEASPGDYQSLLEEVARLRIEILNLQNRSPNPKTNQSHRTTSTAFAGPGGGTFVPSGKAAWIAFSPVAPIGQRNPEYSRSAQKRCPDVGTFSGKKDDFNDFLTKLKTKMRMDNATFRDEEDRMDYLFLRLKGRASKVVETRYVSEDRPFSGLAEMIQTLESAYGNPNEWSEACDRLRRLKFSVTGKWEIQDFIAEFNILADKTNVPFDLMKRTLLHHLPPCLSPSLLTKAKNDRVSYEEFCDYVKDDVYYARAF
ncbi:hypothetical protein CP532_6629 [Ophiocordyceps camponoti-leonardi (nom. inval.)]|nr:hypothetical protein CP532_6629 [Ophiocordyceps camponoti-leonardi (nom. inval.)]